MNRIEHFFHGILEEKEFLRDSAIVVFATSFSAILMFLINLAFSRMFGPELFGNFKNIIYLATVLTALMDLGTGITLTKYIAEFRGKNKKKIVCMTRWFLKLRIVIFSSVLLFLFLFRHGLVFYFLHDVSLNYLIFPALFVIGVSFFSVFSWMVKGYENFKLFSFSSVLMTVSYGIIGLILGYYFGVFYAVIGFGIASLIGNSICLNFLLKKGSFSKEYVKFDVKKIFWKYSIPMHVLMVPNYLGNAVVPLLSLFFSAKLIGYYSFSFMFYYAGLIIPGCLSTVLFPKVSKLNGIKKYDDAKKTLKRVMMIYTPIVIGGIIGCLLFSELVVSFIAPEYLPGLLMFKVLVCFGLLVGYAVIYTSYLSAKEKLKETAIILLVQNVLLFVISFVLLKTM